MIASGPSWTSAQQNRSVSSLTAPESDIAKAFRLIWHRSASMLCKHRSAGSMNPLVYGGRVSGTIYGRISSSMRDVVMLTGFPAWIPHGSQPRLRRLIPPLSVMMTLICSAERDLGRMDEISQYERERGLVILAPHHAGQVAVNCGRSRGDHMKLSRRRPMIIKRGATIRTASAAY